MGFASIYGLSNVTIGEISKATELSRSGVIAHFKDKEDMQISIVKFTELQYLEWVVEKSRDPNSLTRLENYFRCWRGWIDHLEEVHAGGSCPFIKGLIEYQDREESGVQRYIMKQQRALISYIARLVVRCINDGHFKSSVDPEQFAYQAYSNYFGYNVAKSMFGKEEAKSRSQAAIKSLIQVSLV